MQMPVCSSSARQYWASVAPGGRVMRGKAYMAPVSALHWMPGMAFSPFSSRAARRSSESSTSRRSWSKRGKDGSPGRGGRTMTQVTSCPAALAQRATDWSFSTSAITSAGTLRHSRYPPRWPHSPKYPFDTE